jgi:hypothetical protein
MAIRRRTIVPPSLLIDYESEAFPAISSVPASGQLSVSWDDILWSAVTIGRPNLLHVFQHGATSDYEALFRWYLIRMALQQNTPRGRKLRRTNAFKTLDPTEKGAVNYFLGMVFCKLFAEKLLGTPWLLHLDVFRHQLDPKILTSRSRPDLVGQQSDNDDWHSFECKGRATAPSTKEKEKAKFQAQRLVSVDGQDCALHIGAITYFKSDILRFYWRDPEPEKPEMLSPINVELDDNVWGEYYQPIAEIFRSADVHTAPLVDDSSLIPIERLDLVVGAHPKILPFLRDGNWQTARLMSSELRQAFEGDGFRPDGLIIKSGPSWRNQRDA